MSADDLQNKIHATPKCNREYFKEQNFPFDLPFG